MLKEDRRRRVTMAGEEVEILLTGDPPLPREPCRRMRGWYIESVDHAPPPAQVTLKRITAERKEFYCVVPFPGDTITTPVPPSPINNSVPTEKEVKWAVRRMRGHRLGGPFWMHENYLREWLQEHIAAEAPAEEEMKAVGDTFGTEGMKKKATDKGMADGGEEREKTKWEKVVELVQLAF